MLPSVLPTAQIVISVFIVAAVLLQPSSAGIGGALSGGQDGGSAFHTKRGFEKFLFLATIVLSILFAALGVLAIL